MLLSYSACRSFNIDRIFSTSKLHYSCLKVTLTFMMTFSCKVKWFSLKGKHWCCFLDQHAQMVSLHCGKIPDLIGFNSWGWVERAVIADNLYCESQWNWDCYFQTCTVFAGLDSITSFYLLCNVQVFDWSVCIIYILFLCSWIKWSVCIVLGLSICLYGCLQHLNFYITFAK